MVEVMTIIWILIAKIAFWIFYFCARAVMRDHNERENKKKLEKTWNQPSMTRPLVEAEVTAPSEQPYAHNPSTHHNAGQYPPVPHRQPPPQYPCAQCSGAPPVYLPPSDDQLNQTTPETGNGDRIIKLSGNVLIQHVP